MGLNINNKIAKIIYGNSDYFMSIDLAKWLKARSKVITDISSATLLVKSNPSDSDGAALVTKTLVDGIIVSGNKHFVQSAITDFGVGKLISGETYGMYYGVKLSGDTVFREVILAVSSLKILSDGIRG